MLLERQGAISALWHKTRNRCIVFLHHMLTVIFIYVQAVSLSWHVPIVVLSPLRLSVQDATNYVCDYCRRRLPSGCFDNDASQLCQACTRKTANPNICSAVNDVVTECDIQTTDADTTFEAFVERNANVIRHIVNEYRQRLR